MYLFQRILKVSFFFARCAYDREKEEDEKEKDDPFFFFGK